MSYASERAYYEKEGVWDPSKYLGIQTERARLTIQWLPEDTRSVLDVGCGNGVLTNQLPGQLPKLELAFGVDRSIAGLKYVLMPRCQADAVYLPFPNESFDAVVSTEMIEHLPYPVYRRALEELCRVARKYVLISVPYRERRPLSIVACPECGCQFHWCYHMRSYNRPDLERLFQAQEAVRLVRLEGIFPVDTFRFFSAWLPWFRFRGKVSHRRVDFTNLICPQCGYSEEAPPVRPKHQAEADRDAVQPKMGLGAWTDRIWPKKTTYQWWMALYSKK